MTASKIKVLLVDDSSFMRIVLADIVNGEPDIEVVDTATNGKEAVEKNEEAKPDVVLLDMTMKDFDGLYAIKNIMQTRPIPIVILSAIRSTNPDAMIEALNAGAYDFLDKPIGMINSKIRDIQASICAKIREAATVKLSQPRHDASRNSHQHTFDVQLPYNIVAIGASTGGTGAIEQILQNMPSNMPIPIVIAQHMPAEFVESFATRLDDIISLRVKVAREGELLMPNTVYILPGDKNFVIKKSTGGKIKFQSTDKMYTEFNFPSVDALMESVNEVYGDKSIAIILTGMGKDGAMGISKINKSGGLTLAQDEASSVVWGMPRAAYEAGAIRRLIALKDVPSFVVSALS